VIVGAGAVTVNATPLLAGPPFVMTTSPVVAPAGTEVTIDELLQVFTAASVPLNVTRPRVVPKLVPVILTMVLTAPEVGDKLVIVGARTVNTSPLLADPPFVTTTLPVVAPTGTEVVIDVLLQLFTVAIVPLNVTLP
jgi:hypothetical protein